MSVSRGIRSQGGEDGIDGFLALGHVARHALELDREDEGRGVHRDRLQVGRLGVDEIIRPGPRPDRGERADTALQLADDIGQDDVALQPPAGIESVS